MRDPSRIPAVLGAVQDALLSKGDGYSVGKLVAELEGDGSTRQEDPFNVWDEHFLQDVSQVDEWPQEIRDPREVKELADTFEKYWTDCPDMRFCQIVCNAHALKNGLGNFDTDKSPYATTIDNLDDEQLLEYLEDKLDE